MSPVRNIITITLIFLFLIGTVSHSQTERNALAILNLRPTNMEAMGYDGEILYALISALEKKDTIGLMPRREMEDILFQAGLVQGDTPEMALEIGKVLGINFVLFGRVTKKIGRIETKVSLLDVQYRRVVKSWAQMFSGREDILARMPLFAEELSDAILNGAHLAVPSAASAAQETQPQVVIENLQAKGKGKNVVLTWKFDPSQPIIGFNVYRSENSTGPYQFFGQTDKNVFDDFKIIKGRSYYYRIGILHSSGKEIRNKQTADIKCVGEKIPHPPLVLSGKAYIRRIEIKFVPSLLNEQEKFKIQKYNIYRKLGDDEAWENINSIPAAMTSQPEPVFTFEDNKDLEDDKIYTYTVSSMDKKNRESPKSDLLSVKTMCTPVLAFVKDNLLRKVIISWEPMKNVDGYYLYRKGDQEDWVKVRKISDALTSQIADDKDLADGQNYQYYLTAYDIKGETGPSNQVHAKTKVLPPFPQDIALQSAMVKSVRLSWTPVQDPDVGGYAIYRRMSDTELELIVKVKGYQSQTYLDKGKGFYAPLEDGTYYSYAVASYNRFGAEGKLSLAQTAKTKPRPGRVNGLMATAQQNHILVKWGKNPEPDIKSYTLYRSKNDGRFAKITVMEPEKTRYADNDLKPEVKYRYRIIAEDQDRLKSDPVESESIPSPIIQPEG